MRFPDDELTPPHKEILGLRYAKNMQALAELLDDESKSSQDTLSTLDDYADELGIPRAVFDGLPPGSSHREWAARANEWAEASGLGQIVWTEDLPKPAPEPPSWKTPSELRTHCHKLQRETFALAADDDAWAVVSANIGTRKELWRAMRVMENVSAPPLMPKAITTVAEASAMIDEVIRWCERNMEAPSANEIGATGRGAQSAAQHAVEAWEQGFCIIAARLNEILTRHAPGLRIDAQPPEPNVTLKDAAQRLSNALIGLRPYAPKLPRDGDVPAWTLGHVNDLNNRSEIVGLYVDTDRIDATLEFLDEKRGKWDAKPWRACIVDSVHLHAAEWRTWCDQFLVSDDAHRRDLAILRHWVARLNSCRAYVAYVCPRQIKYHPHEAAEDTLRRLSEQHKETVTRIQSTLAEVDRWREKCDGDETARDGIIDALSSLLDAVAQAVDFISADSPKLIRKGSERPSSSSDEMAAAETSSQHQKQPIGFLVADLRTMTGLENTALRKYAKKAGVVTPGRGKKNHRYSRDETRRILETIINSSGNQQVVENCRESLDNRAKIGS